MNWRRVNWGKVVGYGLMVMIASPVIKFVGLLVYLMLGGFGPITVP